MKNISLMKKKQLGQGMTEYIIIVALIAVAAIGAYSFFGETVRDQVAGLASEISGQAADQNILAAQAAAKKVDDAKDINMGTYNSAASGMTTGGGGE